MTAQGVGIFTFELSDPNNLAPQGSNAERLPRNVSFEYPIRNNVQTLSPKNADGKDDPVGVLFVPDLQSDECKKREEQHIPANTTRLHNLPEGNIYALIALAPWFSAPCMHEYLRSARDAPVRALLVYQPGTSASMPPSMNDVTWGLGDGGTWKTENSFPTYALASATGGIVVDQLGLYSANVTDVPFGQELISMGVDPTDYVRLCAAINTDSENKLPSVWVFLLIVLGLLVFAIVLTSSVMHIVQRRRREDLRQRVVNGEVNLEAVGVKRLTIPREFLEKLPMYTYSGPEDGDLEKKSPQSPARAYLTPNTATEAGSGVRSASLFRRSSAPSVPTQPTRSSQAFSQPTCPICLDDFEQHETQVRELPCWHIFHPECVDTFLLNNSSLCPMCKKSVLPSGYCPPRITNVMVRRERMIARMRAQRIAPGRAAQMPVSSPAPTQTTPRLRSRIGGAITGRRVFSAPEHTPSHPSDIEMAVATTAPQRETTAVSGSSNLATAAARATGTRSGCSATSPHNRREWARERALTLLGDHHVPGSNDDEEHNMPLWKRGLQKVFPGFR